MPPKLQAALFRVLASLPGIRAVPGAVDAANRAGVAVTRRFATGDRPVAQEQDELIFDATPAHRFLGSRAVTAARTGRYPAGTPLGSLALLGVTAVRHLPAGVEMQDDCR